jgi:Helix-turn-helix domain
MASKAIRDFAELDEKQAAQLLGVRKETLNKWRYRQRGPAFYPFPDGIRYKRVDIIQWLESRRVDPAAERARRKRTNQT